LEILAAVRVAAGHRFLLDGQLLLLLFSGQGDGDEGNGKQNLKNVR
jgi:hypothetical protein